MRAGASNFEDQKKKSSDDKIQMVMVYYKLTFEILKKKSDLIVLLVLKRYP